MSRIRRKWRPILALVIGGTLAAVLLAPMVGLVVVKFLWGYMRYRYAALLVGGGCCWSPLFWAGCCGG